MRRYFIEFTFEDINLYDGKIIIKIHFIMEIHVSITLLYYA
jgi:hypothetical protein